jgi:amino acid transporter
MTATSVPADPSSSLERNAIGLPEVLFQSITHMAPAVATALSIGAATGFAGGITPLAVVFAMVAVLFTAYSISQLALHLPSAGGMYTYVARGLGPFFGWLMAWAFALAEPLVAPILLAAFGLYGGIFLSTYLGIGGDFQYLWIILAVLCGLVLWWLVYSGIQLSTRTGLVLGLIEIGIFLVISLLLIVNAGARNTISVFIPGEQGLLPALQGMVFCLLAFV